MTDTSPSAGQQQPLGAARWLQMALFAAAALFLFWVAGSEAASHPPDAALFFALGLIQLGVALESPYLWPWGIALQPHPGSRDSRLKSLADRIQTMAIGALLLALWLRWGVDWPTPQSMPTCP